MKAVIKGLLIPATLLITHCSMKQKVMITSDRVYQTNSIGFSQAVVANGFVFISGQVGWDKDFSLVGTGSFSDQLDQCFKNVNNLLEDSRSSMDQVVHIRIYIKHLGDSERILTVEKINQLYPRTYKPANTVIGVETLARPELLVEVEAVATLN